MARTFNSENKTVFDINSVCKRCGADDHWSKECQNERIFFCWICGQKNTKTADCCGGGVETETGNSSTTNQKVPYPKEPFYLDQEKGLCVIVGIGYELVHARIDTCSFHSFIGEFYANELGTATNITNKIIQVSMPNGAVKTFKEELRTKVKLGNWQGQVTFVVNTDIKSFIVLGLDFLTLTNTKLTTCDVGITLRSTDVSKCNDKTLAASTADNISSIIEECSENQQPNSGNVSLNFNSSDKALVTEDAVLAPINNIPQIVTQNRTEDTNFVWRAIKKASWPRLLKHYCQELKIRRCCAQHVSRKVKIYYRTINGTKYRLIIHPPQSRRQPYAEIYATENVSNTSSMENIPASTTLNAALRQVKGSLDTAAGASFLASEKSNSSQFLDKVLGPAKAASAPLTPSTSAVLKTFSFTKELEKLKNESDSSVAASLNEITSNVDKAVVQQNENNNPESTPIPASTQNANNSTSKCSKDSEVTILETFSTAKKSAALNSSTTAAFKPSSFTTEPQKLSSESDSAICDLVGEKTPLVAETSETINPGNENIIDVPIDAHLKDSEVGILKDLGRTKYLTASTSSTSAIPFTQELQNLNKGSDSLTTASLYDITCDLDETVQPNKNNNSESENISDSSIHHALNKNINSSTPGCLKDSKSNTFEVLPQISPNTDTNQDKSHTVEGMSKKQSISTQCRPKTEKDICENTAGHIILEDSCYSDLKNVVDQIKKDHEKGSVTVTRTVAGTEYIISYYGEDNDVVIRAKNIAMTVKKGEISYIIPKSRWHPRLKAVVKRLQQNLRDQKVTFKQKIEGKIYKIMLDGPSNEVVVEGFCSKDALSTNGNAHKITTSLHNASSASKGVANTSTTSPFVTRVVYKNSWSTDLKKFIEEKQIQSKKFNIPKVQYRNMFDGVDYKVTFMEDSIEPEVWALGALKNNNAGEPHSSASPESSDQSIISKSPDNSTSEKPAKTPSNCKKVSKNQKRLKKMHDSKCLPQTIPQYLWPEKLEPHVQKMRIARRKDNLKQLQNTVNLDGIDYRIIFIKLSKNPIVSKLCPVTYVPLSEFKKKKNNTSTKTTSVSKPTGESIAKLTSSNSGNANRAPFGEYMKMKNSKSTTTSAHKSTPKLTAKSISLKPVEIMVSSASALKSPKDARKRKASVSGQDTEAYHCKIKRIVESLENGTKTAEKEQGKAVNSTTDVGVRQSVEINSVCSNSIKENKNNQSKVNSNNNESLVKENWRFKLTTLQQSKLIKKQNLQPTSAADSNKAEENQNYNQSQKINIIIEPTASNENKQESIIVKPAIFDQQKVSKPPLQSNDVNDSEQNGAVASYSGSNSELGIEEVERLHPSELQQSTEKEACDQTHISGSELFKRKETNNMENKNTVSSISSSSMPPPRKVPRLNAIVIEQSTLNQQLISIPVAASGSGEQSSNIHLSNAVISSNESSGSKETIDNNVEFRLKTISSKGPATCDADSVEVIEPSPSKRKNINEKNTIEASTPGKGKEPIDRNLNETVSSNDESSSASTSSKSKECYDKNSIITDSTNVDLHSTTIASKEKATCHKDSVKTAFNNIASTLVPSSNDVKATNEGKSIKALSNNDKSISKPVLSETREPSDGNLVEAVFNNVKSKKNNLESAPKESETANNSNIIAASNNVQLGLESAPLRNKATNNEDQLNEMQKINSTSKNTSQTEVTNITPDEATATYISPNSKSPSRDEQQSTFDKQSTASKTNVNLSSESLQNMKIASGNKDGIDHSKKNENKPIHLSVRDELETIYMSYNDDKTGNEGRGQKSKAKQKTQSTQSTQKIVFQDQNEIINTTSSNSSETIKPKGIKRIPKTWPFLKKYSEMIPLRKDEIPQGLCESIAVFIKGNIGNTFREFIDGTGYFVKLKRNQQIVNVFRCEFNDSGKSSAKRQDIHIYMNHEIFLAFSRNIERENNLSLNTLPQKILDKIKIFKSRGKIGQLSVKVIEGVEYIIFKKTDNSVCVDCLRYRDKTIAPIDALSHGKSHQTNVDENVSMDERKEVVMNVAENPSGTVREQHAHAKLKNLGEINVLPTTSDSNSQAASPTVSRPCTPGIHPSSHQTSPEHDLSNLFASLSPEIEDDLITDLNSFFSSPSIRELLDAETETAVDAKSTDAPNTQKTEEENLGAKTVSEINTLDEVPSTRPLLKILSPVEINRLPKLPFVNFNAGKKEAFVNFNAGKKEE